MCEFYTNKIRRLTRNFRGVKQIFLLSSLPNRRICPRAKDTQTIAATCKVLIAGLALLQWPMKKKRISLAFLSAAGVMIFKSTGDL
jgi:hypothetical protein